MTLRCKMSSIEMNEYYQQSEIKGFKFNFCGKQLCESGHCCGPHARNTHLMVYVASGKGIFQTRKTTYHLEKGATFFIFPHEITLYKADANDPWEYYWISFDGESISEMLSRASITPSSPIHITNDHSKLVDLYNEIIDVVKTDTKHKDILLSSIFLKIIHYYTLSSHIDSSIGYKTKDHPRYMDVAIDYIHNNYGKNYTVTDIAHHISISREYFCRKFQDTYALSPKSFIKTYKLNAARLLLLTTDNTIAEVADKVGFNNYNYFSSEFTKHFNMTPSRYRRAITYL